MAEWTGPECTMCQGTGKDSSPVTVPDGRVAELVVGYVENGMPCRACAGHGRDAE